MEAFAYAVGLWRIGASAGVIHILDRQIYLIGMVFDLAAILRASVREDAQQADPVLGK